MIHHVPENFTSLKDNYFDRLFSKKKHLFEIGKIIWTKPPWLWDSKCYGVGGGFFKHVLIFTHTCGKIPILTIVTSIFQMGWFNHQLSRCIFSPWKSPLPRRCWRPRLRPWTSSRDCRPREVSRFRSWEWAPGSVLDRNSNPGGVVPSHIFKKEDREIYQRPWFFSIKELGKINHPTFRTMILIVTLTSRKNEYREDFGEQHQEWYLHCFLAKTSTKTWFIFSCRAEKTGSCLFFWLCFFLKILLHFNYQFHVFLTNELGFK